MNDYETPMKMLFGCLFVGGLFIGALATIAVILIDAVSMRDLIDFLILLLTSIISAWLFAVFATWWIGMTILTVIIFVLCLYYLREIIENETVP